MESETERRYFTMNLSCLMVILGKEFTNFWTPTSGDRFGYVQLGQLTVFHTFNKVDVHLATGER